MKWGEEWPEGLALLALVIFFVVSVLTLHTFLNSLVALLAGALFGNYYYKQRKKFRYEATFIGIGALIGLVLGNIYGNVGLTLLLFIFGAWGTYYLHHERFIRTK